MPTLPEIASQIRRDILKMVHGANSGHPGGSLGCADLLTALYFKIMKHTPAFDMNAREEDVSFFLMVIFRQYFMPRLPVPGILM
jgi:transketolase